jgi:hypothetical protein
MATVCSSFYFAANTGTVLGLSVTNAVLQGTVRHGLAVSLRDEPQKDLVCSGYHRKRCVSSADLSWVQIIEKAMLSIDYIQTLPEPIKTMVIGAYSKGFEFAHGISSFLLLHSA